MSKPEDEAVKNLIDSEINKIMEIAEQNKKIISNNLNSKENQRNLEQKLKLDLEKHQDVIK